MGSSSSSRIKGVLDGGCLLNWRRRSSRVETPWRGGMVSDARMDWTIAGKTKSASPETTASTNSNCRRVSTPITPSQLEPPKMTNQSGRRALIRCASARAATCCANMLVKPTTLGPSAKTSSRHSARKSSTLQRIKARRPDWFVIFGGSNCEGVMGVETLRQFEFVDAVVSGEADFVFPAMVQSILASDTIPPLQGVSTREDLRRQLSRQPPSNTPLIRELDELPIPDYDDYFEQLAQSSLQPTKKPILSFETSRGCWWGEKLHCTFCGLNGATMAYRSKSAERALDELTYLAGRYPGYNLNAVDNIL